MTAKIVDKHSVTIDPVTGLVRVDAIIICKSIKRDGKTYLQFKDGDRLRSNCRKTCLVEIELGMFAEIINGVEILG